MNDASGTNKIKMNSHICVIDISFFLLSSLNWVGVISFNLFKGGTEMPLAGKAYLARYVVDIHVGICK